MPATTSASPCCDRVGYRTRSNSWKRCYKPNRITLMRTTTWESPSRDWEKSKRQLNNGRWPCASIPIIRMRITTWASPWSKQANLRKHANTGTRRCDSGRIMESPMRCVIMISIHRFILFCSIVSLAARGYAADQPAVLTPSSSSFETLSRFTELLEALQKNYAQPSRLNAGPRSTTAFRGFVRSVDPEADLLTLEEAAATNESVSTTADIGLSFAVRDDFPTVISPHDGSPAESAGLLAGEQILAIGSTPMPRARRIDVDRLLHGPASSSVNLRVFDPVVGTV